MSNDKLNSRRAFLKNLGKTAAATLAIVPFVTGNLCFSEETLNQIENDLGNIKVQDGHKQGQNDDAFTCGCSASCGSNYAKNGRCECSGACGSNYSRGNCECSGSCGTNYARNGYCECSSNCGTNYNRG